MDKDVAEFAREIRESGDTECFCAELPVEDRPCVNHETGTETRIQNLLCAYDAGVAAAAALKLGDVFLGASPAAVAAGYSREQPHEGYSTFLDGYLTELDKRAPKGIWTSPDNRIVGFAREVPIPVSVEPNDGA